MKKEAPELFGMSSGRFLAHLIRPSTSSLSSSVSPPPLPLTPDYLTLGCTFSSSSMITMSTCGGGTIFCVALLLYLECAGFC